MGILNQPEDLAGLISAMERRIEILETVARVPNISTTAGSQTAVIPTQESSSSGTYGDLTTPGPSLTGVNVSAIGVLIVIISASGFTTGTTTDGFMSIDLTGPSGIVYSAADSGAVNMAGAITVPNGQTFVKVFRGLSAGSYSIAAKYRRTGPGSAAFQERSITAIPL